MMELELPGFRFHPTEEELLEFYLKQMVFKRKFREDIIGFLNIYHHDPWDLPGLAKIGEREWYFFVPRDRKQGNGGRPNRTTVNGFWKATGSDRQIRNLKEPKKVIGLRKTMVFYKGRAPKGCRTDWVMNEYRMPDNCKLPKEAIVLCKVYRKATSMKVLEERAAMEDKMETSSVASSSSTTDPISFPEENNFFTTASVPIPFAEQNDTNTNSVPTTRGNILKSEIEDEVKDVKKENEEASLKKTRSLQLEFTLPDLQLPKTNMDWSQDPYWTQLHSPWMLDWPFYSDISNLTGLVLEEGSLVAFSDGVGVERPPQLLERDAIRFSTMTTQ